MSDLSPEAHAEACAELASLAGKGLCWLLLSVACCLLQLLC